MTHPPFYYITRKIAKNYANSVLETFSYSAIFKSYWKDTLAVWMIPLPGLSVLVHCDVISTFFKFLFCHSKERGKCFHFGTLWEPKSCFLGYPKNTEKRYPQSDANGAKSDSHLASKIDPENSNKGPHVRDRVWVPSGAPFWKVLGTFFDDF